MFKTIALCGMAYLLGNEPARKKVESTIKKALSTGLNNFSQRGVANADEPIIQNSNKPSATPITE